jgi:type I restriction enzyme R subunit
LLKLSNSTLFLLNCGKITHVNRVVRLITEELPVAVLEDVVYQNVRKNSDKQNACVENDKAAQRAAVARMSDETE